MTYVAEYMIYLQLSNKEWREDYEIAEIINIITIRRMSS